jgi:hypothetical protein
MGCLAKVAVCTHSKGGEADDGAHARAGREAHSVEHDGQAGMELGDDLQGREKSHGMSQTGTRAGRRNAKERCNAMRVSFSVQ